MGHEMKRPGRPPIRRKAMTPAQRQARHREKLRRLAKEETAAAMIGRRLYQPPHGHGRAKERLLGVGHTFERARSEFGFEE